METYDKKLIHREKIKDKRKNNKYKYYDKKFVRKIIENLNRKKIN